MAIDTNDLSYSLDTSKTNEGAETRKKIEQKAGRGDTRSNMSNIFMGFNHRMSPLYVPGNRDSKGYTFFTRPDLNFSAENIEASRRFLEALRGGYKSQAVACMAALDPTNDLFAYIKTEGRLGVKLKPGITFDNRQAFIPFLSNLLVSLTGFPDSTLDVYTTDEGILREQISMVDSTYLNNGRVSLNSTFRSIDGDPTLTLITFWLEWMAGVKAGTFVPRAINLVGRHLDYQSRIYRWVLDPTRRYVRKWGYINAGFPINDSMGEFMNISNNGPLVDNNDTLNVQWECIGAHYNDPITIQEFNEVVQMFNPDMLPQLDTGSDFIPVGFDSMRKLSAKEADLFNYFGYPRIDPNSYEFQWWVYSNDYDAVLGQYQ